jgi:K+-transporting ATPase KdpF subunit
MERLFEWRSRQRPEMAGDLGSMIDQNLITYLVLEPFGRRQDHVGYRKYRRKRVVFCHCDWIRDGVRPARGEGEAEMIETLALGLVTVALLVYLVYALLRPEKF